MTNSYGLNIPDKTWHVQPPNIQPNRTRLTKILKSKQADMKTRLKSIEMHASRIFRTNFMQIIFIVHIYVSKGVWMFTLCVETYETNDPFIIAKSCFIYQLYS